MAKYEVRDVVCDYGIYEDGELKFILNSRSNAERIRKILEDDQEGVVSQLYTIGVVRELQGYGEDELQRTMDEVLSQIIEGVRDTARKYPEQFFITKDDVFRTVGCKIAFPTITRY